MEEIFHAVSQLPRRRLLVVAEHSSHPVGSKIKVVDGPFTKEGVVEKHTKLANDDALVVYAGMTSQA